jgi:hypothetical protein
MILVTAQVDSKESWSGQYEAAIKRERGEKKQLWHH